MPHIWSRGQCPQRLPEYPSLPNSLAPVNTGKSLIFAFLQWQELFVGDLGVERTAVSSSFEHQEY